MDKSHRWREGRRDSLLHTGQEYHKASADATHVTDWDASAVGDKGVLDVTKLGLSELSMRVRVGRNLTQFNLPGAMDKSERIEFEKAMLKAFDFKALPVDVVIQILSGLLVPFKGSVTLEQPPEVAVEWNTSYSTGKRGPEMPSSFSVHKGPPAQVGKTTSPPRGGNPP